MTKSEAEIIKLKYAITQANFYLDSICSTCNNKQFDEFQNLVRKNIFDMNQKLKSLGWEYNYDWKNNGEMFICTD